MKVVCTQPRKSITLGNIYVVTNLDDTFGEPMYKVVDDTGNTEWYFAFRFTPLADLDSKPEDFL